MIGEVVQGSLNYTPFTDFELSAELSTHIE